jgi:hypothetical protein
MRPLTTLCIYLLLAATSIAQSITVTPFEGIVAKSVKVEQLTDSVVVILTDRQAGTKTGAYLQIESDKKWATPLLDGVTISQTKTAGEWILFANPGKYRLLLAEFDPDTGPRYSFHDLVIPGATKPDPKPDDPVPPPTGDFAELQSVAKRVAAELNDPKTRNALSAAYKSTLPAMQNRTYEQNVAAVKSARNFVLSSRLGSSRMVDWNQWLLAVDVELQKVVRAGDNAAYATAIDAIATALQ